MLKKTKVLLFIMLFLVIWVKEVFWDYNWVLKWPKVWWAVTVYDKQVKIMQDRWYSKQRILDLLAIQSMECNLYNWNCKSSSDIWNFQINQIHKNEYNKSAKLLKTKKYGELYKYQLTYANWLLDSYEKSFCSKENIIWKFWKYSEKLRVECYWRMYNWSKKKVTYWKMLWQKREMIKKYFNIKFK